MHVEKRGILYGSVIEPHPHAELKASFRACSVCMTDVSQRGTGKCRVPLSAHLYFSRSLATGWLYSCLYTYIYMMLSHFFQRKQCMGLGTLYWK